MTELNASVSINFASSLFRYGNMEIIWAFLKMEKNWSLSETSAGRNKFSFENRLRSAKVSRLILKRKSVCLLCIAKKSCLNVLAFNKNFKMSSFQ